MITGVEGKIFKDLGVKDRQGDSVQNRVERLKGNKEKQRSSGDSHP